MEDCFFPDEDSPSKEEKRPPDAANAAPETAVPKKDLLLSGIPYRVWFPCGVPAM
jgi:hypothetical protein